MRIFVVLMTLLFALPVMAQDDTTIRSYYEPEGDIFVGQTVRLWVEIVTTGAISTPPKYPELKIEGAISLLPEQGAVSFSDTSGGQSSIGLRQRYVIIPQRAGLLEIPTLQIEIGTDHDGTEELHSLSVSPEPLNVIFPPGMENLDRIVSTSDLKVSETYDRDLVDLQVGDAITRTVTVVAGNTFAIALPEIVFAEVKGAKQYPATPNLSDKTNRGQYRATRIDSVTYVFEDAGQTSLPEILVQWWDPDSKSLQETLLESVDLTIAANPNFTDALSSGTGETGRERALMWLARVLGWVQNNIAALTVLAITLYVLRLAFSRFAPVVRGIWQDYRRQILQSERYAFRQFRASARSGDVHQVRNAFWKWLNHFAPADQTVSLSSLTVDDDVVARLSQMLNPDDRSADDIPALLKSASQLRNALLAGDAQKSPKSSGALNPGRVAL